MRRRPPALLILLPLAAACGGGGGSVACGISALAGPVMILDQFSVPGQTLATAPRVLPETISVRVAAGPAVRGLVGRTDTSIVVGVDEPLPAGAVPGFGVLIAALATGQVRGVVLFEGAPVAQAPELGTIQVGDRSVPLLGLRVEMTRIEDPNCPLFPEAAGR